MEKNKNIKYPYVPENRKYLYVPFSNEYMKLAYEFAKTNSLDKAMPNSSVLVKDGVVLGRGANGSKYHETHECERVKLNLPSGVGYELCEGCHPKNHSERSAIADAREHGFDPSGADIYLWGHWWCCEPCWEVMIESGIQNVYLLEGSEILFNKNEPGNIVGRQFE